MFVFDLTPTYSWPVHVEVPTEGGWDAKSFTAVFKLAPTDFLDDVEADAQVGERVREHWVGWGPDVVDGQGEPIPFSEEARDALFRRPDVRRAVVNAYLQSYGPQTTGNSEAPRSIGSAAPEPTDATPSPKT